MANEEIIWKFLKQKGFTDAGIAGAMGNMDAESALQSNNLENTGNSRLGMSNTQYTAAVDNGTYTNFVYDSFGYGICQWTWWSRKKALLDFCEQKNKSIGDLTTQLEFFVKELQQSFSSVYKTLITSDNVKECSDTMLFKFEAPAAASSKSTQRYNMSMTYYNKFVKGETPQMATNTYQKGLKKQLSQYFVSTEFDCHGRGCCSTTLINPKLVEYLNKIREHFNAPITISSGYRCITHNRGVGGATGSRHTKGDAADIIVKGHSPREVAQYAESIGIKGIGLYETAKDGYFVHVDTRDYKSFWYGQGQAARTTFGGSSTSNNSSSTSNNGSIITNYMSVGDTGSNVKNLQKLLIQLGYNLGRGGADGIFGEATKKAVMDFQKKKNLVVDGLAGKATLDALYETTNESNAKSKVTVTANLLNVRLGPGTQYAIIDRLSKGATCQLSEIQNGWGHIENKGWVSMDYVS